MTQGSTGFIPVAQYPANQTLVDPNEVVHWTKCALLKLRTVKYLPPQVPAALMFMPTLSWPNRLTVSSHFREALRQIFKPLGSAGSADPLEQRQTVGWKATFVAYRLNENFMQRYEHAVTA